jgi:hypothetical protein
VWNPATESEPTARSGTPSNGKRLLSAVLYQLFTGHRLFAGETTSDEIAAVLTRELNLAALPSDVPPGVSTVLKQCFGEPGSGPSQRRTIEIAARETPGHYRDIGAPVPCQPLWNLISLAGCML